MHSLCKHNNSHLNGYNYVLRNFAKTLKVKHGTSTFSAPTIINFVTPCVNFFTGSLPDWNVRALIVLNFRTAWIRNQNTAKDFPRKRSLRALAAFKNNNRLESWNGTIYFKID